MHAKEQIYQEISTSFYNIYNMFLRNVMRSTRASTKHNVASNDVFAYINKCNIAFLLLHIVQVISVSGRDVMSCLLPLFQNA